MREQKPESGLPNTAKITAGPLIANQSRCKTGASETVSTFGCAEGACGDALDRVRFKQLQSKGA
jgi:hypothetical protein